MRGEIQISYHMLFYDKWQHINTDSSVVVVAIIRARLRPGYESTAANDSK